MRTTVTVRHGEVPERLRARAEVVLGRLAAHSSRPVNGTVVFDTSAKQSRAEIRLHISRGAMYIAKGEGVNHRSALDKAEEKLRRQLEKRPARTRRRTPVARNKA